jgi:uncharacterized membrane protein
VRLIPRFSGATWGVLALLALAAAGVTHATAILALPWRSHRDAFARVAALGPIGTRVMLPDPGGPRDTIPFRDPGVLTAACRYDLRERPFRLAIVPFGSGFVTVGFHSRHGLGFYGLTVQAADATRLDLALFSKAAADGAVESAGEGSIKVEAPEPDGFVTVGTPVEDGDRAAALDRLDAFQCRSDEGKP